MRKVLLRMNEYEKYDLVKQCVDNNGNKNHYALKLGISVRQLNRLIKILKDEGKRGFIHGNRSRKPINKHSDDFVKTIIAVIKEKYLEKNKNYTIANFTHLVDLLLEYEKIKIDYSSLYRMLMDNGIRSPRIRKSTRKRIKKEEILRNKKILCEEKDIDSIVNHQLSIEDAHPTKKRALLFGEELQMDACSKTWSDGFFAHLHLAIDNATGMVVGGYFDNQETLNGYYNITKQFLEKYGVPHSIKTDKRTVFIYDSLTKKEDENNTLIQYAYAAKHLGIQLICSSVPQFKALVERANQTFEDRLSVELKLNNIKNLEEANFYLINTFIPNFNKKFALDYKTLNSAFQKIDKDMVKYYLAVLSRKKINSGCTISYKSKTYILLNEKDERMLFLKGTSCMVIKTLNNELYCNVDNEIYIMQEFDCTKEYLYPYQETSFNKHEKKKYIPPMDHPWRYTNYDKFQQSFKTTGLINV